MDGHNVGADTYRGKPCEICRKTIRRDCELPVCSYCQFLTAELVMCGWHPRYLPELEERITGRRPDRRGLARGWLELALRRWDLTARLGRVAGGRWGQQLYSAKWASIDSAIGALVVARIVRRELRRAESSPGPVPVPRTRGRRDYDPQRHAKPVPDPLEVLERAEQLAEAVAEIEAVATPAERRAILRLVEGETLTNADHQALYRFRRKLPRP